MKPAGRSGGAAPGNLWKVDSAQTIGRRSEQQDAFGRCTLRLDDGEVAAVAVVADGMGGEVGGKIAAETAVAAFIAACQDGIASDVALRLRDALYASNAAVGGAVAEDPRLDGMGCTLVALALGRGRAAWISVGDSLLLGWRGGVLERLNADHSMAPALEDAVRAGEMTAEQAAAHPQRSILLSALTGRALALVDERSAALPAADRFILATDGLLSLGRDEIAQLLSGGEAKPGGLAETLVRAVEKKGYADQDNCTVLVVTPSAARTRRRPHWPGFLLMALGLGLIAVPLLLLWPRPPDGSVHSTRPPPPRVPPPPARIVPSPMNPLRADKPKPRAAPIRRHAATPAAAGPPRAPTPAPTAAGGAMCGAHSCRQGGEAPGRPPAGRPSPAAVEPASGPARAAPGPRKM